MAQIKADATVSPEGELTIKPVRISGEVPPGEYSAVVELEPRSEQQEHKPIEFLVLDIPWPEGLSLRREDMYGDWGR